MFEYGFVENVDYLAIVQKRTTATSGDLCVLGSELHEFLEVKTRYDL